MDIGDEIDRSFGSGPEGGVDVDRVLAAGHRALLRRRLAVGAGALATVAVIGGTTWASSGAGGSRADDTPMVGGPTRSATTTTTPSSSEPPDAGHGGRKPTGAEYRHVVTDLDLAGFDEKGRLVIDPRATLVDRIDNPFDLTAPRDSAGVAVRFRGSLWWYATSYAGDGSSSTTVTWAGNYDGSFSSWVQGQSGTASVPESVGDPVLDGITYIDLVRFVRGTEKLEPVNGATILEQRAHVSVGASFAGPADHTAAAEVEGGDGKRYYVLARSFDGKPGQYIAVPVSRGGATLDDFLALARQRYADGGPEGRSGLK